MFNAADMFKAFGKHRDKAIVIATGTSGRHWREASTDMKRDVALGGSMGQTTAACLGLALGLPNEKVCLFDSEGSLLMNLGILPTVSGKQPKNFYHFLMDNECYATTGGQPVANAQNLDWAGMAKSAGYAATYHFDNLEDFASNVGDIMKKAGPVFVSMKIVPEIENEPIGRRQRQPAGRSRGEMIRDLREIAGVKVS
ncbi:MAG: thiamine pyrophosphate-binding protein [Chloroflexi bacterium]|nr:thiamine pyrophosphate-binding protein [Chloroflexota bacterium]